MPNLLISIIDGNWVAEQSNTGGDVRYQFRGGTLDEQSDSIITLSFNMQYNWEPGEQTFPESLTEVFDITEEQCDIVSQQLFGMTDGIIYNGEPAYTAIGGDFLIDCLEEAGMALAIVLGV